MTTGAQTAVRNRKGENARALRAEATTAAQSNSPAAATLDAQATALEAKVETLFRGETLRGLLLTSYGFSFFGDKAMLAAWVCFGAAFALLLASAAGFIHAFRTSRATAFAPVEPSETAEPTTLGPVATA